MDEARVESTPGRELRELIQAERRSGDRVYAVVDAARDRELAFWPRDQAGQRIRWLFREGTPAHMRNVAPYLVPVDLRPQGHPPLGSYRPPTVPAADWPGEPRGDWPLPLDPTRAAGPFIARAQRYHSTEYLELWGGRVRSCAGILLVTPAAPAELWRHLHGLFHVQDEEGHRYYLRFYDPRVLSCFLPTCTASQLDEFFGPIRRILALDATRGELRTFARETCRPMQVA